MAVRYIYLYIWHIALREGAIQNHIGWPAGDSTAVHRALPECGRRACTALTGSPQEAVHVETHVSRDEKKAPF